MHHTPSGGVAGRAVRSRPRADALHVGRPPATRRPRRARVVPRPARRRRSNPALGANAATASARSTSERRHRLRCRHGRRCGTSSPMATDERRPDRPRATGTRRGSARSARRSRLRRATSPRSAQGARAGSPSPVSASQPLTTWAALGSARGESERRATPIVGDRHAHRGCDARPGARSRGGGELDALDRHGAGRAVREHAVASRERDAIGRVESFSTSTTVSPPASATEQTRWTASPVGTRTRVSTTAVPDESHAGAPPARRDGTCQRSSAATYQSRLG